MKCRRMFWKIRMSLSRGRVKPSKLPSQRRKRAANRNGEFFLAATVQSPCIYHSLIGYLTGTSAAVKLTSFHANPCLFINAVCGIGFVVFIFHIASGYKFVGLFRFARPFELPDLDERKSYHGFFVCRLHGRRRGDPD